MLFRCQLAKIYTMKPIEPLPDSQPTPFHPRSAHWRVAAQVAAQLQRACFTCALWLGVLGFMVCLFATLVAVYLYRALSQ